MTKRRIAEGKSSIWRSLLIILFLAIAILITHGQNTVTSRRPFPEAQPLSQPATRDDSRDVIYSHTHLVSVAVTVTDRSGQAITGLRKEDFKVFDDKVEQPISYFSDEDSPASIGIVFDTSGSMNAGAFRQAQEALTHFIQTSHPKDEYVLIGFNSTAQLLLDRTRDGTAVLNKFTYAQPHGATALYDGVHLGMERLLQATYPKHAIILISDGEENNSRYGFGKLRKSLEESGVIIYTVRVGTPPPPMSVSWPIMEPLASISGGKHFCPTDSEQMAEAFEQIALDLRRQYSIAFVPANFVADGKRHKIKVVFTAPREQTRGMVIRHRDAYYAGGMGVEVPPQIKAARRNALEK